MRLDRRSEWRGADVWRRVANWRLGILPIYGVQDSLELLAVVLQVGDVLPQRVPKIFWNFALVQPHGYKPFFVHDVPDKRDAQLFLEDLLQWWRRDFGMVIP